MSEGERMAPGRRSWDLDREVVMNELAELNHELKTVIAQLTELRIEVGKLTVKAGIWGALAGAATAAIPLIGLTIAMMRAGRV